MYPWTHRPWAYATMLSMTRQAYKPMIQYDNLETLIGLLIEVKEIIPANEMRYSSVDYFIDRFSRAMQDKAIRDGDYDGIARWTKVLQGDTKFMLPNTPESVKRRKEVQNDALIAKGINPFKPGSTEHALVELQKAFNGTDDETELDEVATPDLASWVED